MLRGRCLLPLNSSGQWLLGQSWEYTLVRKWEDCCKESACCGHGTMCQVARMMVAHSTSSRVGQQQREMPWLGALRPSEQVWFEISQRQL